MTIRCDADCNLMPSYPDGRCYVHTDTLRTNTPPTRPTPDPVRPLSPIEVAVMSPADKVSLGLTAAVLAEAPCPPTWPAEQQSSDDYYSARRRAIRAMRASGAKLADIATEFGISVQRASQLTRAG